MGPHIRVLDSWSPVVQRLGACLRQAGKARGGAEGAQQGAGDLAEGAGARAFQRRIHRVATWGLCTTGRASTRRRCGTSNTHCRSSAKPSATCIPMLPLANTNICCVLEASSKAGSRLGPGPCHVCSGCWAVLGPYHPLIKELRFSTWRTPLKKRMPIVAMIEYRFQRSKSDS